MQCVDLRNYNCILCNDFKGAIVETNIGRVHLTCVNWLPDIWFDNDEKTKVGGNLTKKRFSLSCTFCNRKGKRNRGGSCIQCDYKDCTVSFHVRCAINHGIIKSWDLMID